MAQTLRRAFAIFTATALVLQGLVAVGCSAADAAEPSRDRLRIGYLTPVRQPAREAVFRQELARLGYREGHNLAIEYRSADGDFVRLPMLATELARLDVHVIVAVVTQSALAAQQATATVPIVMIGVADPVRAGLVATLARPGANLTGNSSASIDIVGKQLQLLREVRPGVSRVAALWNPQNAVFQSQQLAEARTAAASLGLVLLPVEVSHPAALQRAFDSIVAQRSDALIVLADPLFTGLASRIAALAIAQRLPTAGGFANYAEAGLLFAYGPDFDDLHRRGALYVHRIFNGARPGELPIELPTRFELVVNTETARRLNATLPAPFLSRADRLVP